MKTAIVTDTNSGITIQDAKQLGIFLLPMPVIVEDQCHLEGIHITNNQLYHAIKSGKQLSSSQPSPGDVAALWSDILHEGYEEIVHIPMTSALSSTCQNAAMLAEDFDSKVYVADNRRISATLRESVLEAKEMADAGHTADEIKSYLEDTAYQQSIYLTVSSLEHLKKGGRLSASAATIGTMLHIKPILSIQGGGIEVFSKVRGMRNSQKKMIEALKADLATRFADIPKEQLRIYTAGTLEHEADATSWCGMVQEQFPEHEVLYFPLPCSIASHVGIDCMGICTVIHAQEDTCK